LKAGLVVHELEFEERSAARHKAQYAAGGAWPNIAWSAIEPEDPPYLRTLALPNPRGAPRKKRHKGRKDFVAAAARKRMRSEKNRGTTITDFDADEADADEDESVAPGDVDEDDDEDDDWVTPIRFVADTVPPLRLIAMGVTPIRLVALWVPPNRLVANGVTLIRYVDLRVTLCGFVSQYGDTDFDLLRLG
jgi:hypothetical protein